MYRGFDLALNWSNDQYYKIGKEIFDNYNFDVQLTLDGYISKYGSLNGTKMQENWFPQIKSDIFISHSHNDEKIAISLAGWLSETFGIVSFIDSCIWGYSNDLLKELDDEYCQNKFGNTYNYRKRNFSTSHVHIMLSTAINMMIDKSECLFFLNTPNSIKSHEAINRTKSPWIYSEITISQLIRKRTKNNHREIAKGGLLKYGKLNENFEIEYDLDKNHLNPIDENDLSEWGKKWDIYQFENFHPLDVLYDLNPPLLLD